MDWPEASGFPYIAIFYFIQSNICNRKRVIPEIVNNHWENPVLSLAVIFGWNFTVCYASNQMNFGVNFFFKSQNSYLYTLRPDLSVPISFNFSFWFGMLCFFFWTLKRPLFSTKEKRAQTHHWASKMTQDALLCQRPCFISPKSLPDTVYRISMMHGF